MKSRLIAAVTAASVAFAGFAATPAAAWGKKEQDALKIILGAAAIGVLVNQLDKNDRRTRPAPRYYDEPRFYDDDYFKPAARGRTIPGECVYTLRTSDGPRQIVSSSCARDFGLRKLPRDCAFDIRTSAGRASVYGPRCLAQYGWRIARSR